jgi:hypothetical protein
MYADADEIRRVVWRGQLQDEALAYIKGADVVLTSLDGSFITIMKDGALNKSVKNVVTFYE